MEGSVLCNAEDTPSDCASDMGAIWKERRGRGLVVFGHLVEKQKLEIHWSVITIRAVVDHVARGRQHIMGSYDRSRDRGTYIAVCAGLTSKVLMGDSAASVKDECICTSTSSVVECV